MDLCSIQKLNVLNLEPQNFKWYTFDPCIKPSITYHKLIVDTIYKPFLYEKTYRDWLKRVIIMVTAPLGYLLVGISALIGIIFDSVIKIDLGHNYRHAILEAAAYAGRKDIVTGILNLNRHKNEDLFMPLKNAGIYGHRDIVEDILQRLDVSVKLDLNSKCGMALAISFISDNGHKNIANLVEAKCNLWEKNN